MNRIGSLMIACLVLSLAYGVAAQAPSDPSEWSIYITNDNCPDYTWGFDEEQTRKAFADIVRAHLDEMTRSDGEPPENRDRYNMAVTQEALCFVEQYPDRKDELIRRIKEGRVFVSPYLCNTLWAMQSVEGAIRAFYPARRLERDWGISIDVAEHIEEPSLPWGVATILAGCGVRWLSKPFYKYDSTFAGLKNPPLFMFEGPDGSRIRVVMDAWASNKYSYAQGSKMLRDPKAVLTEWLPHYRQLADGYPVRAILASGTHGDISPRSGGQARGFADAIIAYNAGAEPHPKLVNAALPQFCKAVDEAQAAQPFLQTVRGCFGHSWDVWPVSLAKYAADVREGERAFLAVESLLAVAAPIQSKLHEATRADRERAEWCWAMLGDHAWNGTNADNKRVNAELRRKWSEELNQLSRKLLDQAWAGLGLAPSDRDVAVFNSLSVPRSDLVRTEAPAGVNAFADGSSNLRSQVVEEEGRRTLYCVLPDVAGFGFKSFQLKSGGDKSKTAALRATSTQLEGPFYQLTVDPQTGGIASLVHKATGAELVAGQGGHTLCQTVYHDGQEHTLADVKSDVVAEGPVLARLRISGTIAGTEIRVTNLATVYAELDRVDLDLRVHKPVTTKQERLCQVFPVMREGGVLRIETPAAVIRPRPQPEGDLLPGADAKRFAVQGFVDVSARSGPGVTIAPLDAYVLRRDLEALTFEALGNDQNYREVSQDQNGVTEFRFRYSLRAHGSGYDNAEAIAWSREVASPLVVARGRLPQENVAAGKIVIDPSRAVATCLKPADGEATSGTVLRIWEIGGRSAPLNIGVAGYKRAVRTDLLERNLEELKITDGKVTLDLRALGFAALRLLP